MKVFEIGFCWLTLLSAMTSMPTTSLKLGNCVEVVEIELTPLTCGCVDTIDWLGRLCASLLTQLVVVLVHRCSLWSLFDRSFVRRCAPVPRVGSRLRYCSFAACRCFAPSL